MYWALMSKAHPTSWPKSLIVFVRSLFIELLMLKLIILMQLNIIVIFCYTVQLMDQLSALLDEVYVFSLESPGMTRLRRWSTCKIDIDLQLVLPANAA